MAENQNSSTERYEDGISVADIVGFLRAQLWRIVGLLVAGAVAGALVSFTHPREWEASSVLEIGQIDNGLVNQPTTPVDPPFRAVQRVKVEPFTDQLLRKLSLPVATGENAESDLIRRSINAEVVPTTDLVRLTVRGFSPDKAKSTLKAAQDDLIAIHDVIFREAVARLNKRLADIDSDIATAKAKRDQIESTTSLGTRPGESTPPVNVLLGNMFDVSDRALLETLKKNRSDVTQQLSADRTFNTRPIAEIAVSQRPVAPKRSLYVIVGAMIGLLIGLLWAGRRHARR
jgi:uncharacterized protein involved in exopolysaccharide biosynthesis